RFRLKRIFPDPAATPITILSIDQRSLDRIPAPLMLWHGYFADILKYLVMSNAAVVGVDFAFPQIDKDDERQLALRQAMLSSSGSPTAIVFAYPARDRVEDPVETNLLTAILAGHTLGFANLTVDSDDFIRRQILQQSGEAGITYPSFPFAVASAYAKRTGVPL